MSLPQWEVNKDLAASLFATLDIDTPLVGTGSLLFHYSNSLVVGTLNVVPTVLSGYPEAFVAAKLRTLFHIKTFQGTNAPTLSYVGIASMQGSRNIAGQDAVGKTCYALVLKLPEALALGTVLLQIIKIHTVGSRGLQNLALGTVLASMAYPVPLTTGSTGSLELQWIADVLNLNGVHLVARTGTLLDYSDLTERLVVLDFDIPLVTTVGEGLFCSLQNSVSSDTKEITFDNTTLYELV